MTDIPVNLAVSGEGHDHCGGCGTDVEAVHSRDAGSTHFWDMYSCDMRAGGCGNNWTRTTQAGLDWNTGKNAPTRGLSTSAALGRVHSLPSEQYQANYERAFGHE